MNTTKEQHHSSKIFNDGDNQKLVIAVKDRHQLSLLYDLMPEVWRLTRKPIKILDGKQL